MESNYSNRDFEQFVKENADQYRMFPSEKVWKNINNTLHSKRRWYGAGLAFLLLLTGGAVTWVMVSNPASQEEKAASLAALKTIKQSVAASEVSTNSGTAAIVPFSNQFPDIKAQASSNISPETVDNIATPQTPVITDDADNNMLIRSQHIALTEVQTGKLPIAGNDFSVTDPGKSLINAAGENNEKETVSNDATAVQKDNYPLTIESVTNAYQPAPLKKHLSWQLFVTPTISYRKLIANNSEETTVPYLDASGDVNSAVTHKPDLGLQIGLSAGYPLTKSLKLRGGLQFNINRYDIKAFAYNPEVATIDLNNANPPVSAVTTYRNYGGYKANWLQNYYFSVSAPIGAELKLLGNKKTSWGIAGTLQPTYILKDKAYLISTDYKNYAKVPWLVRRVNLSAGFETFVELGNQTRWQIGPQVRYQLLSSFQSQYPVKEHLFDFGLKIGMFLNK